MEVVAVGSGSDVICSIEVIDSDVVVTTLSCSISGVELETGSVTEEVSDGEVVASSGDFVSCVVVVITDVDSVSSFSVELLLPLNELSVDTSICSFLEGSLPADSVDVDDAVEESWGSSLLFKVLPVVICVIEDSDVTGISFLLDDVVISLVSTSVLDSEVDTELELEEVSSCSEAGLLVSSLRSSGVIGDVVSAWSLTSGTLLDDVIPSFRSGLGEVEIS